MHNLKRNWTTVWRLFTASTIRYVRVCNWKTVRRLFTAPATRLVRVIDGKTAWKTVWRLLTALTVYLCACVWTTDRGRRAWWGCSPMHRCICMRSESCVDTVEAAYRFNCLMCASVWTTDRGRRAWWVYTARQSSGAFVWDWKAAWRLLISLPTYSWYVRVSEPPVKAGKLDECARRSSAALDWNWRTKKHFPCKHSYSKGRNHTHMQLEGQESLFHL